MGKRRSDNEWHIDYERNVAIGKDSNGETFLIDADDLPLVRDYTWIVDKKDGYVRTKITLEDACDFVGVRHRQRKRKTLLMHRIILNTPDDKLTDHINRNRTDNRRSNLRVATVSQNLTNKPAKGIYFIKGRQGNYKPWEAYISHESGKMKTKVFATKEEAIAQRRAWEKEYYKEFAYAWD